MKLLASLLHGSQNKYAGCHIDFDMEYSVPERSVITVISVSFFMILHGSENLIIVSTYVKSHCCYHEHNWVVTF